VKGEQGEGKDEQQRIPGGSEKRLKDIAMDTNWMECICVGVPQLVSVSQRIVVCNQEGPRPFRIKLFAGGGWATVFDKGKER
jgi:hypothetical protein